MSPINSRISPLALIVASSLCATPALANNSQNEEQEIESISIIGSRLKGNESSQVVEIDKSNYQSLTDSLAAVPSLQVNNNAGAGSINELYLRGADSNYGLVLFNGIPLNDGTNTRGGVADLSGLSSLVVDRVEISHGSKSSVYGSQAISGVVNFISENDRLLENSYQTSFGLDAEGGYAAELSAEFSELSLSYVSKEAPEAYAGSSLTSDTVVAVYQPELGFGDLSVTLLATDADSTSFPDNSGGGEYAVNRDLEQRSKNDFNLGVTFQTQIQDMELTVQGYTQTLEEDIDTPFVVPQAMSPASQSANKLERSNVTAYISRDLGGADLVAGISYTKEEGSSAGSLFDVTVPIAENTFITMDLSTDFSLSRTTVGSFVEADIDITESIDLRVAGRFDDTEAESVFTPSSELVWRMSDTQTLSVEYGQGFKVASFYALSNPNVGDPNLENEESETIQVNFSQQFTWGQLNLSAYNYEFTNLVDFDFTTFKLVNRSEASTEGAEVSFISNKSGSSWYWQASHAYTNATTDGGVEMVGRAKNKTNLQLHKDYSDLDLKVSASIAYRSGVWGESMATGRVELDDQVEVNLSSDWQYSNQIALSAGIKNLTGDKLEYTPGNVHTGVLPWVSVTYSF